MGRLIELDPDVIKDTIFSRAPLLFSLILVLDQDRKIKGKRLENRLRSIDAVFNDETIEDDDVEKFRLACLSSTQRIAQRKVRQKFLKANLS